MADTKRLVVTREGLQKMKEELEYKETTEKMRIAEQLKVAISYGDLSENAEYDAAKNDQASLEQRINELKAMIENAVVVDESKINTDAVNFGTRVTIIDLDDEDAEEEVYTIVGTSESDPANGKLTTGTHDPRISHVMQTFVGAGAPEDILWQHKPHVGTDLLRRVVKNLREEIKGLGGDVRFGNRLSGLTLQGDKLTEITVEGPTGPYTMACDALILAPGHSFRMLRDAGAEMEQKPFAIGVRIEHRQESISQAQFGPSWDKLPPADYKLVCHLPSGRSAYTFCVCPGGQIVAAASHPGMVVTNGMSNRARDGEFINGGFLVGVRPEDVGSSDPLAGVAFQEIWEKKAYAYGRPGYEAPAQRVGDFLRDVPSPNSLTNRSTYRPEVCFGDLRQTLPPFVTDSLAQALPALDRKLRGFAAPDALMVGVETRSSSPVRVLRDQTFQSNLRGLYPCGEGAGYAGGIVSAAVDGIRVAEAVAAPRGAEEKSR